ncbi:MAG: oligoendopeptidase F [Clostridiales bacterium]|jgi:oligoendopeptidase F|nr:oligoendopeptidase F [Clostridiales bacterium]
MSELKTREQVASEFKWNTSTICESDENWQNRLDALSAKIAQIKDFEGRVGESGASLLACLQTCDELQEETRKLYVYANLKGDEDTAETKYQGMRDKAQSVAISLSAATSFVEPEIIAIGEDKVNEFVAATPGLELYNHDFHNLFRKQKHILSPEIEEIMAKAAEIGMASHKIYDMIIQTDMVFGKVKDSKGEEHEVTSGRFGSLMQNTDRVLRQNVHELYYDTYIKQKNTIAEAYNYSVKNDNFVAGVRKYDSALNAALSTYNIPKEIYKNLIDTISDNMHLFHRYLDLRKRCLEVDELHFYDIYAPIVKDADVKMDWEEAKKTVLEGVAALGPEYQGLIQKSYDENWIDVYENKGKATGAYSWGSYGMAHPYVLMNYDDTIGDMFTLAHEMGHALHSYYTHRNQPFTYGSYTIFLAEVASTVNEALVMEYLLSKTDPRAEKTKYLYLLNEFLEGFKGTFFRQTMFAEFEMLSHEMAERGEPLNTQSLNALYEGLLKKYFGDHIVIDERIIYEWSRIPHFYRAFYVYQYATGYTSAMAFAKAIREEGAVAVEKYLGLLKAGSSDYSVELLKKAGVDMTTPAPIQAALEVFENLLDRFEKANFS